MKHILKTAVKLGQFMTHTIRTVLKLGKHILRRVKETMPGHGTDT